MTMHRPSIRLKLTIIYGSLFLLAGVLLIAVTYGLLRRELAPNAPLRGNRVVLEQDQQSNADRGGTAADASQRTLRRQERLNALRQLWRQALWALLVTTLAVLALGWFVAGELLAPLRQITAHARASSAATLDERIRLDGPDDELKSLADTFDGMLDRLQAAFRAQQGFAAQASHELRTPLAIIRGEAELVRERASASERERQGANAILTAVQRSERLVDDLLALARSESTMVAPVLVDLADLTGDVVGEFVTEADHAHLRLDLSLDAAAVRADPSLMHRMIANLVQNAIRYNRPGGSVSVTVAPKDGMAILTVENSGPAVDQGEVDRLFEPFMRGDWARRNRSGFGLGLTIVQSVAHAHHGTVRAQPGREGGLIVTGAIPLAT